MFISGLDITSNITNDIESFSKKFSKEKLDFRLYPEIIDEQIALTKYDPRLRRADRFTKMAMSSVIKAIDKSELSQVFSSNNKTGIILTSAYGASSTTFSFLDEIISYGPKDSSPIKFSSSVHNAVTAYISISLRITGPTITLTQFKSSIFYGFMTAKSWFETNTCENIILCHVDEMNDIISKAINLNNKNRRDELKKYTVEGCVTFLLTKEKLSSSTCEISNIEQSNKQNLSETRRATFNDKLEEIKNFDNISGSTQLSEAIDIALLSCILKHNKNNVAQYRVENQREISILTLNS